MPTKGSVTINYNAEGHHTLEPPMGVLDRNVQTMQWSLVAPENVKFATQGILFDVDPPAGYSLWPGDDPVREDAWQYRAKVNLKMPELPVQLYRYDIRLEIEGVVTKIDVFKPGPDGTFIKIIDPPIENQPQP